MFTFVQHPDNKKLNLITFSIQTKREKSFNGKLGRHFVWLKYNKHTWQEPNGGHENKTNTEQTHCLTLKLKSCLWLQKKTAVLFEKESSSRWRGVPCLSLFNLDRTWERDKCLRACLCFPVHDVFYGRNGQRFAFVPLRSVKKIHHRAAGLGTPASPCPLLCSALGWREAFADPRAGCGDPAERGVVWMRRALWAALGRRVSKGRLKQILCKCGGVRGDGRAVAYVSIAQFRSGI